MGPLALAAILGGAGLVKGMTLDKDKERRERALRADEIRYSGWTGRGPTTEIHEADPLGTALGTGMMGANFGQAMEAHNLNQQLGEKKLAEIEAGKSSAPTGYAPNPAPSMYSAWNQPRPQYGLGVDYNFSTPNGYSY